MKIVEARNQGSESPSHSLRRAHLIIDRPARLPVEDLEHVLAYTEPLWKEMRRSRTLVTGASGFFGSWMLESLLHADSRLELGARALAVTRSRNSFAENLPHLAADPRVELLEADAAAMPVPDGALDFIIHSLVPDAGTPLPEMDLFFQSATQRLLDIAIQKNSRAFLLCSTGAVYQPKDPPAPFSEEDPLVPLDGPPTYGQIRRRVEDLCRDTLENSPVALKIARGFAFVGPRLPLDANFAIGNFLRDARAGSPIVVKSDGTAIRSYLYAADMAAWLWTILLEGTSGRAFNVGSEEAVSIGDLARRVAKMFDVAVRIASEPLAGAAPSCYLPSTQCARTTLKLETGIELEDAIHKTFAWHTAP